jgi:hypothetical protein
MFTYMGGGRVWDDEYAHVAKHSESVRALRQQPDEFGQSRENRVEADCDRRAGNFFGNKIVVEQIQRMKNIIGSKHEGLVLCLPRNNDNALAMLCCAVLRFTQLSMLCALYTNYYDDGGSSFSSC